MIIYWVQKRTLITQTLNSSLYQMPRRTFLKLRQWPGWYQPAETDVFPVVAYSPPGWEKRQPEIRLSPQARMLLKRGIRSRERTRKWENEKWEPTLALAVSVTLLPILCVVSPSPFCFPIQNRVGNTIISVRKKVSPGENIKKMSGSLLFSCYCWWVNFHSSFGRKRDTLNNAVQVENESRRGCLTEVNFKKLLFCFSIITRGTWRYNVILYFPTMMISIALVTKLVCECYFWQQQKLKY